MTLKPSWHLLNRPSLDDIAPPDEWQILDEFLSRLHEQQSSSRQIRAVLETIQQMTKADLVFACSTLDQGPVDQSGPQRRSAVWCRETARRLLVSTSEGDAHLCTPAEGTSEHLPHSAALVRLSKSRRVWIVAVMFDPGRQFRRSDVQLMRVARRMLLAQNKQTQTFSQLRNALFGLVRCLTASLDARDPYTWGHSERVARMAVRIGHEIGLKETEVNDHYLGGLLHDIGKIGVRDAVLSKPGTLTTEERIQVERHTVIGDAILAHVAQLSHLRPCVRSHHERWDGSGYPDNLSGSSIPLPARILAVADSCDAMLSDRPYRKGMPTERIDQIIGEGGNRQWDPDIVSAFLSCRAEVYAIHQRGVGESVYRAVEQVLRGGRPEAEPASVAEFALYHPDS